MRKFLAVFAAFVLIPLAFAWARSPNPGVVLDFDNGSLTGGAAVNTTTFTASWPGVVRIQFANNSGGSASTAQVVLNGEAHDLGSAVAAGDAAAFVWLIAPGDELDFQVDTSTTGSLKVFNLGQGQ